MAGQWTVERVKKELPMVNVQENGKVFVGKVYGRKLEFPEVWWNKNCRCEAAWSTIANCLNNGRPLIAD